MAENEKQSKPTLAESGDRLLEQLVQEHMSRSDPEEAAAKNADTTHAADADEHTPETSAQAGARGMRDLQAQIDALLASSAPLENQINDLLVSNGGTPRTAPDKPTAPKPDAQKAAPVTANAAAAPPAPKPAVDPAPAAGPRPAGTAVLSLDDLDELLSQGREEPAGKADEHTPQMLAAADAGVTAGDVAAAEAELATHSVVAAAGEGAVTAEPTSMLRADAASSIAAMPAQIPVDPAADLAARAAAELAAKAAPTPEEAAAAAPAAQQPIAADAVATPAQSTAPAATPENTPDQPAPAKHRFWHDLGLMIAQLVDIPFAALPVEAKQVSAVAGGLLAAGGVALVIYTRVHHG